MDPHDKDMTDALSWSAQASSHLPHLPKGALLALLASLFPHLTPVQLASLLPDDRRRDFLRDLPVEVALHVLTWVEDARTLVRVARVSRAWRCLGEDEGIWKMLCARRGFRVGGGEEGGEEGEEEDLFVRRAQGSQPGPLASVMNMLSAATRTDILPGKAIPPFHRPLTPPPRPPVFSYRAHFKSAHLTDYNWRHTGRLLRSHRSQDAGCVTSIAMDAEWIVVGLANSRVHVFSTRTGVLARTLNGHEAGVWALWLVSRGRGRSTKREDAAPEAAESSWLPNPMRGFGTGPLSSSSSSDLPFQSVFDSLNPPPSLLDHDDEPEDAGPDLSDMQSDPCNASRGWGQANALVVSASCDKNIRVWDIKSGYCLYVLRGHRSTVRCIKALHGRPIAVSGGRDHTIRVWDVQKGVLLRTLEGHTDAVRCLDVYGNKVVSGSYDCTVRLWDVDTGECLRVFNGHYHQVYTVAFDGERIASGGLDTIVRIWSASAGSCLALLQGHSALVCQLQLSAHSNTVVTGSSDGRIIVFRIAPALPGANDAALTLPIATASHPSEHATPPSSPPLLPAHQHLPTHTGYGILTRVQAHSSSIAGLQFDESRGVGGVSQRWVVSGGNDGRVVLWEWTEGETLRMVRELTEGCESLWKVAFRGDVAVICVLRAGRTALEIWNFKPGEEAL